MIAGILQPIRGQYVDDQGQSQNDDEAGAENQEHIAGTPHGNGAGAEADQQAGDQGGDQILARPTCEQIVNISPICSYFVHNCKTGMILAR